MTAPLERPEAPAARPMTDADRATLDSHPLQSKSRRPYENDPLRWTRTHSNESTPSLEPDACPMCGGMGIVSPNVPPTDPRFGKALECPACHGGPAREQHRAQQQAKLLDTLRAAGLTTTNRHDWLNWDDFAPGHMANTYAGKEIAIEIARLWADGETLDYEIFGPDHHLAGLYPTTLRFQPTRSLWFIGDFGTGKTALARLAQRTYCEQSGRMGLFIEWSALYETIKGQYSQADNDSYPLLHAAATVPILLLDDIGQMRQTRAVGDDEYKKLWYIVDHRYRHRELETIITSNLDRHQLAAQFDAKIAGRMAEMCLMVTVGGQGFREHDRGGNPGYAYQRAAAGDGSEG
jgi:hypothetical protein